MKSLFMEIPEGFEPIFRTSPFLETAGPLYSQQVGDELIIGMMVLDKHVNGRGFTHTGVYTTLADVAMGYAAAFSQKPPVPLVTVSLSTDFVGNSKVGDWLEVHTDIQLIGEAVAFVNAFIMKDDERIVRVSAVFNVLKKK
ncbi:PaaI family thioesterase [Fibrella forsythiae]|uniref:PaaI family thioesterase n=1 Tax=Fibrella forsythiae TaxID=2817061 RepID=A0ABS3JQG8_9BACT|nr:PaaI family thioesterase [Fibrella forsythiae]MBO0952242.1 PaaI family thioesterase [Fibrella forsythiae]